MRARARRSRSSTKPRRRRESAGRVARDTKRALMRRPNRRSRPRRSNRHSRPRRIAVTTVMTLSLLVAGVFGYWSGAGTINASASLATLSSPAISSATPGAQTVELTWSAVTPPGGGTVEYYVDTRRRLPRRRLPELGLSLDRHELHRHGLVDRRPRIHGHRGLAHLDGDKHSQIGDGCLWPGDPPRARSRKHHAHRRRDRQPHNHRQGRVGRHGRDLLGFAFPDL